MSHICGTRIRIRMLTITAAIQWSFRTSLSMSFLKFLTFSLIVLTPTLRVTVEARAGAGYGGHGKADIDLRDDYYRDSCPGAESVITKVVLAHATDDNVEFSLKFASNIIRLAFHDCFVEGCDASILLDGPNSEKTAGKNEFLGGFHIIDAAKAELESICPGVVSCADILAYAARDSVVALNGARWNVQGGRKDGFVSKAENADANLPSEDLTVSGLVAAFARKGLSMEEMVVLSGSHTAAAGHCHSIVKRLYDFSKEFKTDPSMPPALAAELKALCPETTFNETVFFNLDMITPQFDSTYFTALELGKGVLTSDQVLYEDHRTRNLVESLTDNGLFLAKFGQAMRAMSAIGVKGSDDGEIRKNCHRINIS